MKSSNFYSIVRYYLFKEPKLFTKSELFGGPLISVIWNEFRAPKRDPKIQDESIWSFVSRRFSPTMADNIVDPVFKGICGGDIKYLSANSLLKAFYNHELEKGSVRRCKTYLR